MGILMIIRTAHGFFMVELLIAILIMAIMAFVFMGYYSKILLIQKDTELYLHATTIVGSALEKVLSDKIIPTKNHQVDGLFTIDWHTTVKPLITSHASQKSDSDQFVIVEAVIRWESALKIPRKITLSSGFAYKAKGQI